MATFHPAAGQTYTLQSSISSTQSTVTLTSFTVPVTSTPITMALMNTDIAYGSIAPRTSQREIISFTGITQNADGTAILTGVTRGLNNTYPFTSSSSFKLPHAGATQFILSDAPQVFEEYSVAENNTTITGKWTFPGGGDTAAPVSGIVYAAPTDDLEYASKKYVDTVAVAGAPNANTTTKGIIQLPTQAQLEAGTATGSTGASLVITNALYGARSYVGYAADAGSTDAYAITLAPVPSAYFTGMLVMFMANTQNTGAATINVNGLGAKNLFFGGIALITGLLNVGSTALCQYDGTQFNILSVSNGSAVAATAGKIAQRNSTGDITVSTTPSVSTDAGSKSYIDGGTYRLFTNGTTTKNAADASAAQTIAHGLGRVPKKVVITGIFSGLTGGASNSGFDYARTVYNGTTQSSISNYQTDATPVYTSAATFTLNGAANNGTQSGVVTFDATNITITWTKTNSPTGTYQLLWEAE